MKPILILLCLLFAGNTYSQTFCLRLTEVSNNGSSYVVAIEMQGSANFDLGSSNLQWSYNNLGLTDPVLFSSPLAPPFYQIPTVTTQGDGQVSFNIELGFVGFGTQISASPFWTQLGLVSFSITDPNNVQGMSWSYNGGTTQTVVFLDNEATQIFATSPACLIGIDVPAAVDLLSFEVQKKERSVLLDWTTVSETNNQGFEVQKSVDAIHWDFLTWVDGKGTTFETQAYHAVDNAPLKGSNYYRLKTVDDTGKEEYSPIREVQYEAEDKVQLFPNPADKETFVQVPSNVTMTELVVFDQMGHLVLRQIPDSNTLDISSLLDGIYFVEIHTDDNSRYYKKLLVQKR